MFRILMVPSLLWAQTAVAGDAEIPSLLLAEDDESPAAEESPPAEEEDKKDKPTFGRQSSRESMFEVSFRGRQLSVPRSMLSIWYFDEDAPGWADSRPRPHLNGYSVGVELAYISKNNNGHFWFDYAHSLMEEGYWDDKEEPPDHLDGDFIAPTDNLGLVAFGADYSYEAHMVRTDQTKGIFGLSFLVGGGLGVAFMVGDLRRWGPEGGVPAFARYDRGDEDEGSKGIPRVYPMVDVNAGLRFNFGDRIVFRVEGGLHTMLYWGGALGVRF